VITPGFRVTLEVDGTSYTLHTDRATRVVRCDGSAAATPDAVPEPVTLARRALADELGRPPEAVTIRAVEAVDWPDGSLGCPQPDRMYPAVITPGFRVTLEVDGTSYTLHTDRATRVVRCDG